MSLLVGNGAKVINYLLYDTTSLWAVVVFILLLQVWYINYYRVQLMTIVTTTPYNNTTNYFSTQLSSEVGAATNEMNQCGASSMNLTHNRLAWFGLLGIQT